jgi:hypothetical protein
MGEFYVTTALSYSWGGFTRQAPRPTHGTELRERCLRKNQVNAQPMRYYMGRFYATSLSELIKGAPHFVDP